MDSKSLPESLLDEEDGENDDGKSSTITSSGLSMNIFFSLSY